MLDYFKNKPGIDHETITLRRTIAAVFALAVAAIVVDRATMQPQTVTLVTQDIKTPHIAALKAK